MCRELEKSCTECHRFGFNGKENDREWGNQLIQDYGFRLYNPAIGKFLSVDPLAPDYPWYTPYQFAGNMPIWAIDLDGLEEKRVTLYQNEDGTFDRSRTKVTIVSRDIEIYRGTQRVAYTHLNIVLPDGNVMSKILVEELTDDGKLTGTIIARCAVDQPYEVVSDFYPAARYDYTSKADDNLRYSEDPTTWGKSGNSNLMHVRNEDNAPENWQSVADFYSVVELGFNLTQASNFLVVGRWMSIDEHTKMLETGKIQQGAGGQTFVATSGPESFRKQAPKGSVYVEFETEAVHLLQGGQQDWFKFIGPEANKASKFKLNKQGGKMLPEVKNIQIIDTK